MLARRPIWSRGKTVTGVCSSPPPAPGWSTVPGSETAGPVKPSSDAGVAPGSGPGRGPPPPHHRTPPLRRSASRRPRLGSLTCARFTVRGRPPHRRPPADTSDGPPPADEQVKAHHGDLLSLGQAVCSYASLNDTSANRLASSVVPVWGTHGGGFLRAQVPGRQRALLQKRGDRIRPVGVRATFEQLVQRPPLVSSPELLAFSSDDGVIAHVQSRERERLLRWPSQV
jgi:hypothetical protein